MNLLPAKATDGRAELGEYSVPIDRGAAAEAFGAVTVGIRPEAWRLVDDNSDGLQVRVTVVKELGAGAYVYGTSELGGTLTDVVVRIDARQSHGRARPSG